VESAIHYLMDTKKIVIGGTSAGMAVLGDIDYIPDSYGVYSSEALSNPYHSYMDYIRDNFIWGIPYTYGTITDTHFSERDRLGRTITFMARIIKDGDRTVSETKAIACDEGAAVCVEPNGQAKIFGWAGYNDYVFFFTADTYPDRCESGKSLNWTNAVTVYKVRGLPTGANTFNLSTRTGSGGSWHNVNVNYGVIDNDIQEPD
jgi:cyanophycinase-like exopeptidase